MDLVEVIHYYLRQDPYYTDCVWPGGQYMRGRWDKAVLLITLVLSLLNFSLLYVKLHSLVKNSLAEAFLSS